LWWKLAAVRAIKKRKKKSTKRVQASAKNNQKKRLKESGKRSTLESQPSLEFESIFLLYFTAVPVLSVCTLSVFVLSQNIGYCKSRSDFCLL